MSRKTITSIAAALLLFSSLAGSALASDHLLNAADAPGSEVRDFTADNPVVGNPSDANLFAQPGSVPGEGNPNFGNQLGTPAVDLSLVSTRSGGNGTPGGS